MFAVALTSRAYLPCGSALYSVRLGRTRKRVRPTVVPLHLERSVSRLPNCMNSRRGRIAKCLWSSCYVTMHTCGIDSSWRRKGLPRVFHTMRARYLCRSIRTGIYEDFAPRKYPVTVSARGTRRRGGISSAAPRRQKFFEFFAWFANTVGIYSNTSIRSVNILTRRKFDPCTICRPTVTAICWNLRNVLRVTYRDRSLILHPAIVCWKRQSVSCASLNSVILFEFAASTC